MACCVLFERLAGVIAMTPKVGQVWRNKKYGSGYKLLGTIFTPRSEKRWQLQCMKTGSNGSFIDVGFHENEYWYLDVSYQIDEDIKNWLAS